MPESQALNRHTIAVSLTSLIQANGLSLHNCAGLKTSKSDDSLATTSFNQLIPKERNPPRRILVSLIKCHILSWFKPDASVVPPLKLQLKLGKETIFADTTVSGSRKSGFQPLDPASRFRGSRKEDLAFGKQCHSYWPPLPLISNTQDAQLVRLFESNKIATTNFAKFPSANILCVEHSVFIIWTSY